MRSATLAAPASAAPEEMPAKTPASETSRRVHSSDSAGPHDPLAVEQLVAAPLLVDGRDVAVVEVAQALDQLARRAARRRRP